MPILSPSLRRLLLVASLMLGNIFSFSSGNSISANPYRKLRLDILTFSSVGFVFKNNTVKALDLAIEPRFALTENWSIGVRGGIGLHFNPLIQTTAFTSLQNSIFHQGSTSALPPMINQSPAAFVSHLQGTIDFYPWGDAAVRFYGGIGIGIGNTSYSAGKYYINNNGSITKYDLFGTKGTSSYFLFSPRIGIDVWHLRFNVVCNFAIKGNQAFTLGNFKYINVDANTATTLGITSNATTDPSIINRVQNATSNLNIIDRAELISQNQYLTNLTFQVLFFLGGGLKKERVIGQ